MKSPKKSISHFICFQKIHMSLTRLRWICVLVLLVYGGGAYQLQEDNLANSNDPLVLKLLTCPSMKDWLLQVLSQGPIMIKRSDTSRGTFHFETRTIVIDPDEQDHMQLANLVMELCRSLNHDTMHAFRKDVVQGRVGRDAYVDRWLRLDWKTLKTFMKLMKPCLHTTGDWTSETYLGLDYLDHQRQPLAITTKWDVYYTAMRKSVTALRYEQDWDRSIKDLFCAKHPQSTKNCLLSKK